MAKEYLFKHLLPFLALGTGLWFFLTSYKEAFPYIIGAWTLIVVLLIVGIARKWFD